MGAGQAGRLRARLRPGAPDRPQCSLGEIKVIQALRDVGIILVPMLGVLLFVILFPEAILMLPRWLMPRFVN